ncbi:MAG: alkaline phosphatase family protein, partial [Acidimicrobiales bacterium]
MCSDDAPDIDKVCGDARLPLTAGPVVIGAGLALFVRVQHGRGYVATVLPTLIVFGLGLALTVAPLTATVLAASEQRQAGVASAVNNAVARAAGLLAVAAVPLLTGFDPEQSVGPATVVDGLHDVVRIAAAACVAAGVPRLLHHAVPAAARGRRAGRRGRAEGARLPLPPGRPAQGRPRRAGGRPALNYTRPSGGDLQSVRCRTTRPPSARVPWPFPPCNGSWPNGERPQPSVVSALGCRGSRGEGGAVADIEHVVVLMFENRSFDHLLGLLSDDPSFPGVRAGDQAFSNPVDPTDPSKGRVTVTDDATPDLRFDPPHSHASVIEQLGLRPLGAPTMEGFVASYARKIAGREAGLPVIHFDRIFIVVGGVAVVVAGVLALPWAGPLLAGAAGVLLVGYAAVGFAYMRRKALPVDSWTGPFVAPAAVVGVVGGLSALLSRSVGFGVRMFANLALVGGAGALAVLRKRKKVAKPPPVAKDQASQIMRCLKPMEQLPALATLAKTFALCTRWHCSVPGATWPNRNFAHAGTSDGTVDIEVGFYTNPTIFNRLHEAGKSWRIYRDPGSLAQVMAFEWLSDDDRIGNWRRLRDFADDVRNDRLPAYSFLEPCHDGRLSNSQHPGNNDDNSGPKGGGLWDFQRGENLIIEVYEALRAAPQVFEKTVLLITYDEHGGMYDHVPPPTDAVAPEPFGRPARSWMPRLIGWFVEQPDSGFRFNVLGPRVPTVIVSPRIDQRWDDTCYDHSSIPSTVRKLFAPGTAPLSAREAVAATFDKLVNRATPRTDMPDLSGFLRPEAVTRAMAAPPPPPRQDEFTAQLAQLRTNLAEKMAAGATPEPALEGAPDGVGGPLSAGRPPAPRS